MPLVKRQTEDGYVVVHHMRGDREAIEFLRSTSIVMLERMCYRARNEGQVEFSYRGNDFIMTWNRDGTYEVKLKENESDILGR